MREKRRVAEPYILASDLRNVVAREKPKDKYKVLREENSNMGAAGNYYICNNAKSLTLALTN